MSLLSFPLCRHLIQDSFARWEGNLTTDPPPRQRHLAMSSSGLTAVGCTPLPLYSKELIQGKMIQLELKFNRERETESTQRLWDKVASRSVWASTHPMLTTMLVSGKHLSGPTHFIFLPPLLPLAEEMEQFPHFCQNF